MSKEHPHIQNLSTEGLLTPEELAIRLRVKRSWIYGHANELGAYRLGKYLRFSLPHVLKRLASKVFGRSDANPPTLRPKITSTNSLTLEPRGTDREQNTS